MRNFALGFLAGFVTCAAIVFSWAADPPMPDPHRQAEEINRRRGFG